MNSKFKGTGVAVITPFHKDGSIDFNSFSKIIEYLIKGKVNYLVVLGSTGEAATISRDEKNAIINFAVEVVNGRVPLVIGIGGNNTAEVVNAVKNTCFDGVDAVLSVSPCYNKPPQKGLYIHYRNISNECPVPVIIYNVPGRTSSNISVETTLKLANDFPNIIGIKDASGDLEQTMKIIQHRPKNFLVISGDDALTLPLMALGADGVISVVGNAFPKEFSQFVNHCMNGDFKKACTIHYKLVDIIDSLFVEGNPAGIKAAMEIRGLCTGNLRLPLLPISKNTFNHLSQLIQEF